MTHETETKTRKGDEVMVREQDTTKVLPWTVLVINDRQVHLRRPERDRVMARSEFDRLVKGEGR